jgi:valyl-tRNA synthetase
MMSIKFTNNIPFNKIYIHGLVRDAEGKKMSKSVGNVIDPLDVIDGITLDDLLKKRTESLISEKQKSNVIKKTKKEFPNGIKEFGADALRFNFCAMASTGRDINFDLNRIEGYRNFCNKLWNASRFIIMTCDSYNYEENLNTSDATIFDKWIMYKLDYVINDFKKYSSTYRFDLMANSIYEFVWNEYCDWYLEIAKHDTSDTTKKFLIYSLIRIVKICHPIIPFITEEIWSELYKNEFVIEKSLTNSTFPSQVRISKENDTDVRVTDVKEMIKKVRKTRTELGIHPKTKFKVEVLISDQLLSEDILDNIILINNLSGIDLSIINEKEARSNDFIEIIDSKYTLYLYIKNMISISDEIIKIEKNILQLQSVLKKIDAKLNNKSFIEKAPSEIINQNVLIVRRLLMKSYL